MSLIYIWAHKASTTWTLFEAVNTAFILIGKTTSFECKSFNTWLASVLQDNTRTFSVLQRAFSS